MDRKRIEKIMVSMDKIVEKRRLREKEKNGK